ncbi:response regulator [Flavihumibacter sp.]|uniref:response regulator n=1 Tax=Flavihumibacter sp. TaxID=1913981 RepID=UPI002FC9B3DD|nr:response regulator [Flavihumibacter sediminis]
MSRTIRIFVVDDDLDDTEIFQEVLSFIDPTIQCSTAENGRDALDKLSRVTFIPDLIFLDLNMPRMDGKECLRKLKENLLLRNIPVIIYTTSSQSKDIEETMEAGAIKFITKPLNVNDLEKILRPIVLGLKQPTIQD